MGEDGTIQGLLELAGAAYVGCGVLGSAAGMDKEATKRVAAQAGLPQVPWAVARTPRDVAAAARRFGYPVFVKPAKMGSSVGVVKVKRPAEIAAALREALRYDDKALVEKGIPVREIETAVLGDPWAQRGDRLALKASIVAEIAPNAEFYDYRAKYLDPNGARMLVPAPLPARSAARVKELARSPPSARSTSTAWRASTSSFIGAPARSTSTSPTRSRASRRSACTPASGANPASRRGASSRPWWPWRIGGRARAAVFPAILGSNSSEPTARPGVIIWRRWTPKRSPA